MTSTDIAFVCPGQGAQNINMIQFIRYYPEFEVLRDEINNATDEDIFSLAFSEPNCIARNEIGSILTVAASIVAADTLMKRGIFPAVISGYSIGLWSAMCLAGMLERADLFAVVWKRARLMNSTRASADGGMLAVLGLKVEIVESVCAEVYTDSEPVMVANYNAPGNVTIAGSRLGLSRVRTKLIPLLPQKLVDLAVQGAWHSPLLTPAVGSFRSYLDSIEIKLPSVPVISNNSGLPLPTNPDDLRTELAFHLSTPVRWDLVVRKLITLNVCTIIEVGWGNILSKFGFYIDRSVHHVPYEKYLTTCAE